MRLLFIFSLTLSLSLSSLSAQSALKSDTVSLLFIGDIMGHASLIDAALSPDSLSYNFESMFSRISPIIRQADFSLANLEVTLAGPPYTGYPRFSSPDALAEAAKKAGIDVLLTANNHANDYGEDGIKRTIKALDSLNIRHTGTFENPEKRAENNLLILKKGSIRLGVLNYTYGTNGRAVTRPSIVNRIDTIQMAKDIALSQTKGLDKMIVVLHWGKEYTHKPDSKQKGLTEFLFRQGVDIIIGSHPHVVQPMSYKSDPDGANERFIAYSMGNFISDQRKPGRAGGAMISLKLVKTGGKCMITDQGYQLTWVYKPIVKGRRTYKILPISVYEANGYRGVTSYSQDKMKVFAKDTRALLKLQNQGVYEVGTPYQKVMTLLNQYRLQYAVSIAEEGDKEHQ